MASVPHASEEFRDYLFWTDLPENAQRYWVGDAPRLTVPDGDVRYARAETGSGAFTTVTVTLTPFALTEAVRMSMQVRTLALDADIFELFFANSTGSNYVFLELTAGTKWQTIAGEISDFEGFADEQAGLVAAAAAGELVAGVLGPLGVGDGYGVSWIDVITGYIPTRIRQRGDGLGMGAPRVRPTGSRYTDERVRGIF